MKHKKIVRNLFLIGTTFLMLFWMSSCKQNNDAKKKDEKKTEAAKAVEITKVTIKNVTWEKGKNKDKTIELGSTVSSIKAGDVTIKGKADGKDVDLTVEKLVVGGKDANDVAPTEAGVKVTIHSKAVDNRYKAASIELTIKKKAAAVEEYNVTYSLTGTGNVVADSGASISAKVGTSTNLVSDGKATKGSEINFTITGLKSGYSVSAWTSNVTVTDSSKKLTARIASLSKTEVVTATIVRDAPTLKAGSVTELKIDNVAVTGVDSSPVVEVDISEVIAGKITDAKGRSTDGSVTNEALTVKSVEPADHTLSRVAQQITITFNATDKLQETSITVGVTRKKQAGKITGATIGGVAVTMANGSSQTENILTLTGLSSPTQITQLSEITAVMGAHASIVDDPLKDKALTVKSVDLRAGGKLIDATNASNNTIDLNNGVLIVITATGDDFEGDITLEVKIVKS